MVEKRNYQEFAVFYPIPTSEDDGSVERKLDEHNVKTLEEIRGCARVWADE